MSEKKTYDNRAVASPHNHKVYTDFLQKLGLNQSDMESMRSRGLTILQCQRALYASKVGFTVNALTNAMAFISKEHNLKEVPGFYKHEKGFWTCQPVTGIAIPVRDYNGNITSLLIRNDRAVTNDIGKTSNKYVNFSSGGKPEGAKAIQMIHCPVLLGSPLEKAGATVRITEGVLKADVATALGTLYTLGLQGLNVRAPELKALINKFEIQELIISLDAGEDESADMLRCKVALIKVCEEVGIDYRLEKWDAKLGKGIDDVLKGGHADKISYYSQEELKDLMEKAHHKNPVNGEWCYIIQQERFYHKISQQNWSKSQFANKFGVSKLQSINDILADGFEQYDYITYEPGMELVIKDKVNTSLNTWHDPEIEPIDGDVSPFLHHIAYLFEADPSYADICLDYLSFIIQNPGKKIRWALVIRGALFGVGKSFIAEAMKIVLGKENVNSPSMDAIHGDFTGWQKNCQLIVVEELMARGRQELMNKLKPMIVAETATIREMRREEYEQPNRFNFLAFSNYDDPLIIEKGDRRYGILDTIAEPRDKKYYDELFAWLGEPQTAGKLKNFFLKRDLSKFNSSFAPMTGAKQEMIDISMSALDEWIVNGIRDETWPFNVDLVCVRHLKDKRVCPPGIEKFTERRIALALKRAGAEKYHTQISFGKNGRYWLWVIRRKELWQQAPLEHVKSQYDQKLLEQEPGNNDWNPLADIKPL